jgi:uncharacterized protein YkwD
MKISVILVILTIITLSGCGGGDGNPSNSVQSGNTNTTLTLCSNNTTITEAIATINKARSVSRTCGTTNYPATTPLTWNSKLATAADGHSTDMATNNFLSHTGSNGSTLADRITAAGYPYRSAGENIAGGYSTIDAVFTGWLNSAEHCANIMSPDFKEYAVSCAANESSQYKTYWTQTFGSQN